ncbi:uncharacterized protein LOC135575697 [Columba livia]|uniref:uncharacterized protein LOC135575697 n=1 Tax=Columba livia TaxID=8932 RepID=UPI0031BB1E1A
MFAGRTIQPASHSPGGSSSASLRSLRAAPLGPMPNEDIDVGNLEVLEKSRSFSRCLRLAEKEQGAALGADGPAAQQPQPEPSPTSACRVRSCCGQRKSRQERRSRGRSVRMRRWKAQLVSGQKDVEGTRTRSTRAGWRRRLHHNVAQGDVQSWGNLLALRAGNERIYSEVNLCVFRTNIPGNDIQSDRREPMVEFVRPPVYHPPQVKFPHHQPLRTWTDSETPRSPRAAFPRAGPPLEVLCSALAGRAGLILPVF